MKHVASYKCRNCGLGNIDFIFADKVPHSGDSKEEYVEYLLDTLPKTVYHNCNGNSNVFGLADLVKIVLVEES